MIVGLLLFTLLAAPAAAAPLPSASPQGPITDDADPGDRALVEFFLPNAGAIDQLLELDADLAEYARPNDDGTITIHAFVTPEERALYESLGFRSGRHH